MNLSESKILLIALSIVFGVILLFIIYFISDFMKFYLKNKKVDESYKVLEKIITDKNCT